MAELCEIAESLALATSSTPAVQVVVMCVAAATGASAAAPGILPPTIVDSGLATSTAVVDHYALLVSAAAANGTAYITFDISSFVRSEGEGKSSIFASYTLSSVSSAAGASVAYPHVAMPTLVSSAVAASTATPNIVSGQLSTSSAVASSWVQPGWLGSLTSSAVAVATAFPERTFEASVTSTATASAVLSVSTDIQSYAESAGAAVSTLTVQIDMNSFITEAAYATSEVWYNDPGRISYVMNTETSALSWYENFNFESIAQPPGRVLAVGPEGLYELAGYDDNRVPISARVKTGFADFGTPNTKRVDAMYFGYTSDGQIAATVEVYESQHPPQTYSLEQRDADAPRNSRIVPGKGLFGRYWRTTLSNVNGANFEIHDASVDIAVSARRI